MEVVISPRPPDAPRLNAVLQATQDAVWLVDADAVLVEVNDAACTMLGYAREALVGMSVGAIDSRHDAATIRRTIQVVADRGSAFFHSRHRRADGAEIEVEVSLSRVEGESVLVAEVRDIGSRMEPYRRLAKIARHVPGMVYQFQQWPDGRACVPYSSPGIMEIFGVPPEAVEADASAVFARIHPDDLGSVMASIEASKRTLGIWRARYRVCRPDGTEIWADGESGPERMADGSTLWHGHIRDVTAVVAAERELQAERRRLRDILWGTDAATWEWNVQTGETRFNARWAEIVGYTLEELGQTTFATWAHFAHPEDLARSKALLERHFRGESPSYECEVRLRHKDGHWVWGLGRAKVVSRTAAGEPLWMSGTHMDITALKEQELGLRQAASVFEQAAEGIAISDARGTLLDVNAAFCAMTGHDRSELLLGERGALHDIALLEDGPAEFYRTLARDGSWRGETHCRRSDGSEFVALLTVSALRDANAEVVRLIALFTDITKLKQHEEELEHVAHYDALTNLPNRTLLAQRMARAMARADRQNERLAIAYVDLDGFKEVNDHQGHGIGDVLLQRVAERMARLLRSGDTLARIGGDEFVAVLRDVPDAAAGTLVLDRLLAAVQEPVSVAGLELCVSASAGVTLYPQVEPLDGDQLIRQADQAMYVAKQAGKGRYHFYDSEQERSLRNRNMQLQQICEGLGRGEFALHYQPKVHMGDGSVVGVEALARWNHPEHGLLAPAAFLPLLVGEELSVDFGDWVIETALTQVETWRAQGVSLPVSVNVDAMQFSRPDFVAKLREALQRHPGVRPGDLEVEVLEHSALQEVNQVGALIDECRKLGVRFALDDFGTGYSSLTYLRRLPSAALKIDLTFVRDMLHDPGDMAILNGIIGLASAFDREVIAEGVETERHGEVLLMLGCRVAQGYGIARPMPAAAVPDWIATWRPPERWRRVDPLPHAMLPLLYAMSGHQACLTRAGRLGRTATPGSQHDEGDCRLAEFLRSQRAANGGELPQRFAALEARHEALHVLLADTDRARGEPDIGAQRDHEEALWAAFEVAIAG